MSPAFYVRIRQMVENGDEWQSYRSTAMTPISDHEEELEMFQSSDARAYLKQEARLERARHGETASNPAE